MPTRREFVKMSCGLCAAITGVGIASAFLQSCSTIPLIKSSNNNGKISVPETDFTDKINYVLVRCKNLENDILLVKDNNGNSSGSYHALLMQCTHQQQPLTVQGKIIHCPAHGSEFDLEGKVTKEPALTPLKRYVTSVSNGTITIDLNS